MLLNSTACCLRSQINTFNNICRWRLCSSTCETTARRGAGFVMHCSPPRLFFFHRLVSPQKAIRMEEGFFFSHSPKPRTPAHPIPQVHFRRRAQLGARCTLPCFPAEALYAGPSWGFFPVFFFCLFFLINTNFSFNLKIDFTSSTFIFQFTTRRERLLSCVSGEAAVNFDYFSKQN